MGGLIKSSVAKKFAMALSGLFLVLFLGQHFVINFTSVISPDTFNELSHFMGTNFLVQALLQPILIFGVIFHFVMGFVLEIRNRNARAVNYVSYNGAANSSWMSRNMIWSGLAILAFLALHFYDFWVPELVHKYVQSHPEDATRYYGETIAKFESPVRTGLYVVAFVFLMLHLLHGFSSSFQSIGWNNKYSKGIRNFTVAYAIIIPLGFIFIALFHYINNL
ncbi:succinate dehydrogenase / fumarate reductase cytochrome b subunit [Mesonia phycicola]|uniref:Succinate dehydrogenase / fumarate reductase cytochrome b subunit n=1 Tax=Mesonia phycicola TaxID=579105 RepID=A0A1M6EPB7_9FLAO|nr:succinate dehydrogenase cytochrome b subunit [Mesonia phycicola]SHI87229.1 succinate dehydrogenase / fumarate reductase cytochrome b subunit [Mesonia phycicola]